MFSFKPTHAGKKENKTLQSSKSINDTSPTLHSAILITSVETSGTQRHEFTHFAKSLVGTPYKYASQNPAIGFDCSGFVNYVANHFQIKVPRSSVEFTNIGEVINENEALEGDLILFTGTNPASRIVGHIGIITENINGKINFIHSSSGKAKGVVINDMSDYYKKRFVKIIRIFPDENKA
jgi:cell wall-associated NlpC family hydrolase